MKPREISETIVHLAYYAGFGASMAAVAPVAEFLAKRGVKQDEIPPDAPHLLSLDEAAEAHRAKDMTRQLASVAPGLVGYATVYLFRDLWLRSDLASRDRSLITVATLIDSGETEQLAYYLNRAMDDGLSQKQAAEVITHLAFYVGGPSAMSALPVAKKMFARRAKADRAISRGIGSSR